MNANSVMKLTGYFVEKVSYNLNKDFDFKVNKRINVKPFFDREMTKLDENNYNIHLSVKIEENDQQKSLPFYIEVAISGNFNLVNWEEPSKVLFAKTNATAILFPYLRSLLTLVTANANVPPYVLPVMNTAQLFKDDITK